ncbi:Uncharacterised protein [Streptococcus equi subsp. zooepidemicus]|nr:Uncharacterised protein [Streptococcus equi subsp. zooepidemicus]
MTPFVYEASRCFAPVKGFVVTWKYTIYKP